MMFLKNSSNSTRVKAVAVAVLVVITLVVVSQGALAESNCRRVRGVFTLTPFVEGCNSLVGLCATGTFRGDIKGNSEFTGTSFTTVEGTATQLVVGDNAIHTTNGDLTTQDVIVLSTNEAGDFAEVDTITDGSGEWSEATGVLKAIGTFTAAGGQGAYVGEICTP